VRATIAPGPNMSDISILSFVVAVVLLILLVAASWLLTALCCRSSMKAQELPKKVYMYQVPELPTQATDAFRV